MKKSMKTDDLKRMSEFDTKKIFLSIFQKIQNLCQNYVFIHKLIFKAELLK